MKRTAPEAPDRVWMHNSLGYWFSVADECKEDGDVEYVRVATAIAKVREFLQEPSGVTYEHGASHHDAVVNRINRDNWLVAQIADALAQRIIEE